MPASFMASRRSAPRSNSRRAPSPSVDGFSARSLQRGSTDFHPCITSAVAKCSSSATIFIALSLYVAGPDKFAWTLRTQKLGHKDVLYAEVSIRNALLSVIAQHRFESFAISPYAIGPPILPEYGDIFLYQLAEPGEHRVHVVEDKAEPVFVLRRFLGIAEALVDPLRDSRVFFQKLAAHHDGVHDREDSGALVVVALHFPVVREKTPHARRVLQYAFRRVGRNERINLARIEHGAQILAARCIRHLHIRWMRVRNKIDRLQRPVKAADEPAARLRLEPKFFHEHAFRHDAGVVTIERKFPDGFAIQVLGFVDSAVRIHKNR